MITNPIIPIWVMTILSTVLIIFIINDKKIKNLIKTQKSNEITERQKKLLKTYIINVFIKIGIIILMFIINLRFMIPNGESVSINSDLNVLFVIDTSVSMRALDYNGTHERFEGVVNDLCYIVDELQGCKFSIITFGDIAQKEIPFTTDSDMVQAELKSIKLENDFYAKGTSMNLVKDVFKNTLKKEQERQKENSKFIVFFISDGEITKEGEALETFSDIGPYILNGAVLGYGTLERWKNGKQSL